jgi:group I intron endonuclease
LLKEKITGIYCIKNNINNNLYIGSSNNIAVRFYDHLYKLRHNKHYNKYLQRAFNKYTEKAFEFKILILCDDEMLNKYEQALIDKLKPEYNISKSAIAPMRGRKHSLETKRKLSDIHKGHPNYLKQHTEETKEKIRLSSLGRKPSLETRKKLSISLLGNTNGKHTKGIKKSKEQIENIRNKNSKFYTGFISPEGIEYKNIFNLSKFCREHNLHIASMHKVSTGKYNTYKGWIVCH